MTVKRFYKIIRRAGCCEQRKASRKTSAGLDESSVYQREKASVNFHALVRDVEAYLIVGYISAAELAVWGMDIKGDEPISVVPTQSQNNPIQTSPL